MNKRLKRILILEILILALFCLFAVIKRNDFKTSVDISLEEWESDYIEFQNGGWQIGADWVDTYGEKIPLLYGPYIDLPKGDYTITIVYQCDVNQSCLPYANKPYDHYIKAETATLDKCLKVMSYDFRATEDIDDFEFIVYYNGDGNFSISQITIQKNDNQIRRMFVYLVFLFAMVNAILWYQSASNKRKKYILAIAAIAILSSLPLFFRGLNDVDGQDLVFHLMRIEGIAKEIQLGNFPVRISSAWIGEYGYPTSIYYGDALLYIPAVLRILGFDVNSAYKIFVFLLNLSTVVIAEYCFGKIAKKENISLILTLAYTTSSYRLVDIYARSAVGEYVAIMFLPVIALAIYNIYTKDNQTINTNIKNATILAIGMTGVITAHVLSAEMIVFVLVLVCLLCIKRTCAWKTIRTYLLAIGETVLLSAFFIVPFLDYYLNVPVKITYIVNDAAVRTIQENGCNIGDYFDYFSNPFSGRNNLQLNPGLILMLALILGIVFWINKKATSEMKVVTGLSLILIYMSTNLFPWNTLSYNCKIFDFLAQVQFPWRYIAIINILSTLLLGFVLEQMDFEKIIQVSQKTFVIVCVIVPVCTTCIFTSFYADYALDTIYYDTENLDTYYIMNSEYLRLGSRKSKLDGKIEAEGTEYVELLARTGCSMDLACKTNESEGYVVLPVINYKGYVITDDYGNNYTVEDSENSYVSFQLPKNFEGNIYLRFEEPWYWTAALGVSIISAISVLCASIKLKRKNN